MVESPHQLFDQFSTRPGVSVRVSGKAKVLEVKRDALSIEVTVPDDVLEWFADVMEGTRSIVHGWQDYEGYDDTPREKLAEFMATDIEEFIENLLTQDIRVVAYPERTLMRELASMILRRTVGRSIEKHKLEWLNSGIWEQAIPL